MTDKPRERAAAGASLALALCLLVASPAAADTFKPTRFDDPVPGKCKPKDCSLREAIDAAQGPKEPGRVVLGEGTYLIELPEGANDNNEDGDFDVGGRLAIRGKGPEKTKISGNSVDRVFDFGGLVAVPSHFAE